MVFFTGTLQEGIQTALQQSKLVVCFVTDDQEESKTWETEYLTDDSVAPSLEKDAVVLRLEAGSQEAGYLAAIFPLPKTPTLVIIKNGELKEYVAAGTAKDELLRRVARAFSTQTASNTQAQPSSDPSPSTISPAAQTTTPAAQTVTSSTTTTTTPSGTSPSTAALLTEAERRREAARKEREDLERERRRKAKGKLPAEENDPSKTRQSDAVKKASQQLAERQRQAREERARVLRLIEDDKAERRARQERERLERQGESPGVPPTPTLPAGGSSDVAPSSPAARRHDQCAIQVRLLDGSTIRSRFASGATLARDVRPWIDGARTDGSGPYTFKVILTPRPNRAIDHAGEEEQSLADLGLAPSATLVLTPVDRYSSAYTNVNAGLTSPVSRLVTAVLAFVANILGGIAGALGGLGGSGAGSEGGAGGSGGGRAADGHGSEDGGSSGGRQDAVSQGSSSAAQASGRDGGGAGGARIKGFQNPDDSKKDYQLYNGNSVRCPSTYLMRDTTKTTRQTLTCHS